MKTKYFLLIVLVFSIVRISAQSSGNTGWFWQYPKPQGNTLHDIFVFNKDTAIAVGDLSTIIKTTDGGNTWDVKTNVSPAQILFSVYFIDANTGWAGGGNYLLKTTDGGNSWKWVYGDNPTSFNTEIIAVYFVDSDTGFVFGDDGNLSRTTDGGKSWITKNMDDYIGGYLDVFSLNAVTFTNKDTGWVVGGRYYSNQIYKTTDCGRTWQWNEQIISPKDFEGLNDIYFLDKNNGFIVGDGGAFIKTTDGGNIWQSDSSTGGDYSVCFTDSLNGCAVGGGYYSIILKTTDGGKNWATQDSNEFNGFLFKVRYADKINGWIVGQFGMIFRTTDGGNNWISQREPTHHFNSVFFVDENTGWAVGKVGDWESENDSGIVLRTTNGGNNWKQQYVLSTDARLNSVYALDKNKVWVVGGGSAALGGDDMKQSTLLYTQDGGLNWNIIIDLPKTYWFESIYFINDSTGWISGTEGTLLKTTNGGNTWNQIYLNKSGFLGIIQFIDENTGWVSCTSDSLLKTTNGGKSWTSCLIDSNLGGISFQFVDVNTGWAVGNNYMGGKSIYKTFDGGKSWYACPNSPNGSYTSIHFINESTGWAVGAINSNGANGIITNTTNGGDIWFNQECPSTSAISNLFILDESTGWAVGDGIFKTTDGGGIVSVKEKNNNGYLPKQVTLFQNYPNPFNPSTIINYQLTMISYVTLKVYDILGKEVKTLVNGLQQAGTHSVNFNASNLASGVYFYRLLVNELNNKNGNFIGTATSETKKMILIR